MALNKHLLSKAHLEKARLAAAGGPKVVSSEALRARKFSSTRREFKRYYCGTCDMAFGIKGHISKHFASKKHLRKIAAASA
jgi:hypothetical protein